MQISQVSGTLNKAGHDIEKYSYGCIPSNLFEAARFRKLC